MCFGASPITTDLCLAIAIPMGMQLTQKHPSVPAQDIINALRQAEEQYRNSLSSIALRGNALDVRESVVTLAVIKLQWGKRIIGLVY